MVHFEGEKLLNIIQWVHRNHLEPHHDTPVLHNSNLGGIRTGRSLTGFPGVWRHFWEKYPFLGGLFFIFSPFFLLLYCPHIIPNNFCFHNMAQKWLERCLTLTSPLPSSGPFKLVMATNGKPKLKNSNFPHSHIPIPSLKSPAIDCGGIF